MATLPAILIRRANVLEALLPPDEHLAERVRKGVRYPLRKKQSRVHEVRVWQMDPTAYDSLVSVLRDSDIRAEVYSPPGTVRPSTTVKPQALSDRATLGVTEAAPWPVVESAYRAMALLYHPDRAGYQETERMKRINLAFERLQAVNRGS